MGRGDARPRPLRHLRHRRALRRRPSPGRGRRPPPHRPGRRHLRPRRARLRRLLGRGAALRRAAGVRPVRHRARRGPGRAAVAGPGAGPWTSASTKPAFTAAWPSSAGDRRRRRLPGEPHPPAGAPLPGPGAGADIAALGAALAEGNAAPFSAVVRLPGQACTWPRSTERFLARRGRRCGRRPSRAPPPPPTGPGQGPRRERDDRRPRPQRPGPGVRVGLGDGADLLPSSTTRGWSTSCARSRGGCARPRLGRGHRRHLPSGLGHRGAEDRRVGASSRGSSREPRGCTAGPSGGSTPTGRGRPQRGDPHVLDRG